MTIKELEERTGMTRANIRFYESEGLLSPARRENGYRDYSEEDVKTLEKIKLLRELHLDIDTIRLVQKGELPLERALFTLLTKLEGDKAALDRAAQVCRELERTGVEYGALEPGPWLEQLSQTARPQLTPPPQTIRVLPTIEEMEKKAGSHPWMRLLAREVDVSIYSLLIHAVLGLGFRVNLLHTGSFADWLISLSSLALMFVAEPLWLHFWGWTPGKWIFGLKLRNRFGEKLSLSAAWSRGWGIFSRGYGFNIPIYILWRHWKSYRSCREGEDCDWDYGEERQYTKEDRSLSWLMWLGAMAASVFLAVTILLQTYLPPNRGALTAQEYYQNFNYYLKYIFGVSSPYLDEEGDWASYSSAGGIVVPLLRNVSYSPVEVELSPEGYVAAVTLSDYMDPDDGVTVGMGTENTSYLYMTQTYYQIATAALAGTQREFNCFNYDLTGWLELWEDKWDSFELDYRGIHISQTVECSGYTGVGQIREPVEGRDQHYRRTVTISLNGSE